MGDDLKDASDVLFCCTMFVRVAPMMYSNVVEISFCIVSISVETSLAFKTWSRICLRRDSDVDKDVDTLVLIVFVS